MLLHLSRAPDNGARRGRRRGVAGRLCRSRPLSATPPRPGSSAPVAGVLPPAGPERWYNGVRPPPRYWRALLQALVSNLILLLAKLGRGGGPAPRSVGHIITMGSARLPDTGGHFSRLLSQTSYYYWLSWVEGDARLPVVAGCRGSRQVSVEGGAQRLPCLRPLWGCSLWFPLDLLVKRALMDRGEADWG